VPIALLSSLAACSSSTNGGGGTGTQDNGDAGSNGEFLASGTFTASGDDAGSSSAKLTGFQSSLAEFLTSNDVYQFSVAANDGDGTSSATFTSPSGINSYTFTSSVIFPGAPAVGMSYTASNSCGGTSLDFGPMARPFEYDFQALVTGANCTTVGMTNGGTWTLSFTSVSPESGGTGNFYTAHGSFTSMLSDGMGGKGTLDFTF
jgi:hypothetical protein